MLSFLRSDTEINKYVKRPSAETKEKAMAFIDRITIGVDNGQNYYWVIAETGENKMIGSICLWNFSEDRAKAEIGYDLSPDQQGRGIMNEAMGAILDFGFGQLGLECIEAYTHWDNRASRRLLEQNRFVLADGIKDEDNADNLIYVLQCDPI